MGRRSQEARARARPTGSRRGHRARSRLVEMRVHYTAIAAGAGITVALAVVAGARMPAAPDPLFVESAAATGLVFTHVNGATGKYYLPEMMGAGVALFDYDNDGDLDVFLVQSGAIDAGENAPAACRLFRNDLSVSADGRRTLRFTDVTKPAGISVRGYGMGTAVGDYDNDGYLDLFVTAFGPTMLLRNDGRGRFVDVTERAGITKADGAGLGVAVGDYNGDGWPDLYVANDATPNQLWINRRDGTFVDEGVISGSALSAAGNPEGSMGIASGDFDLDGDEDLFVTNIVGETSVLYVNDGRGNFDDARARSGLAPLTAAFTGFGTDWIDYDNDGWPDLFVANGAVNIVEAQRGQPWPYRMTNQLFHNTGAGTFVDASASGGPAFARAEIGRGAAFGDIDNDGDVDIVVTNNNGPVRLLLNQAGARAHWLQIRLDQRPGNRFGIGARVGVERAGRPTLWRRVRTDGSYLSASDVRLHFGLGPSAAIAAVVVQWPDGQRERWTGISGDRFVTLRRGSGQR